MNPDTKLTQQQIKYLCDKHDLRYSSHQRITYGFTHEVHRLNKDMVIKIYNYEQKRFKTESAALSLGIGLDTPTIIAADAKDKTINRPYIIMNYIEGRSLGSCWHLATRDQREKIIKKICKNLKKISSLDGSRLFLNTELTWQQNIDKKITNKLAILQNNKSIKASTATEVQRFWSTNKYLFENDISYPVFWDIHFDNCIVDDNFKLQALIDLENIEMSTLDFPRFTIKKQMEDPKKYLHEEDEEFADKKDYSQLEVWYKKYYPEMFDFEHADERLNVYQLLDVLHLLVRWPKVNELHDLLGKLVG